MSLNPSPATMAFCVRVAAASVWIMVSLGKLFGTSSDQEHTLLFTLAAVTEGLLGLWILAVTSPRPHLIGLLLVSFFLFIRAMGFSPTGEACGCLGTAMPTARLPVWLVMSILVVCHLAYMRLDRVPHSTHTTGGVTG